MMITHLIMAIASWMIQCEDGSSGEVIITDDSEAR